MKWFLALLLCAVMASRAAAQFSCYRPPVVTYPPVAYQPPVPYTPYAPPPYYYVEKVPYVLEVQVYKDRYFSLSDLYRDRLYVEAFDMMREMRQKLDQERPATSQPAEAPRNSFSSPAAASGTSPPGRAGQERKASYGKAGERAKEILVTNCASCHGAGNDKLDLTDPDAVPPTKRWASFGMVASRDMPQAPRGKSKEEAEKWKSENGLKDDQLKILYDEWVTVPTKGKP